MSIDGLALQELREIIESIAEQSDGDWLGADDARLILALMDERDARIDGDAALRARVDELEAVLRACVDKMEDDYVFRAVDQPELDRARALLEKKP